MDVVQAVARLADAMCPSASPSSRQLVTDFSMSVLGSLVGAGRTPTDVWVVADRIQRRLTAVAAPSSAAAAFPSASSAAAATATRPLPSEGGDRRGTPGDTAVTGVDGDDVATRFQVLRAKLLASPAVGRKAALLATLLAVAEHRHTDGVVTPQLPPVAPVAVTSVAQQRPSAASAAALLPPAAAPSTPAVAGPTSDHPAPPALAVGDARLTHFTTDGLPFDVSQAVLVRDVVYAFEGIDGTYVKQHTVPSPTSSAPPRSEFRVVATVAGVPLPTRGLVARLGELGWLYNRVAGFVAAVEADGAACGETRQALAAALQVELTSYFGSLAALGAQLDHRLLAAAVRPTPPDATTDKSLSSSSSSSSSVAHPSTAPPPSTLTLRRLWVWAQEPLQRLRLLAALADTAGPLHGGALASAVHQHTVHGDPLVQRLTRKLLGTICVRLLEMTTAWVQAGELFDPHGEFFIVKHDVAPGDLWASGYTLNHAMLPSFVPHDVASEVLLVGKSINFMRSCCGDSEWVMHRQADRLPTVGLSQNDLAAGGGAALVTGLRHVTSTVAPAVNARLLHLLFDSFHLLDHLQALKRYLLLAQGDTVSLLLEAVAPELDKPAARQMHHTLAGLLEGALRMSNAQFESKDVLDRLDVRCTGDGSHAQDSGWDVFMLTYHVGEPLSAVVTAEHMATYTRVFSFLWRLKRVEFTLSNTWCRHMTAAHQLRDQPVLRPVLHMCHLLRNEMLSFASTLVSYIMFEVVEIAWTQLIADVKAASTLADIISAHNTYLDTIVTKQLMAPATQSVAAPLQAALDEALRFTQVQEQLYARALAEVAQQERHAAAVEQRARLGEWGTDVGTEASEGAGRAQRAIHALAAEYGPRVQEVAATFRRRMLEVLRILERGSGKVEEFRHLAFRMDYNGFYSAGLEPPAA